MIHSPVDGSIPNGEFAAVEVRNITPHPIDVVRPDGTEFAIPQHGPAARVTFHKDDMCPTMTNHGVIPIIHQHATGEVTDLPDPEPGVLYIVSPLVAARCPHRNDLCFPDELVRDADGKIIACRALSVISPAS